jgi:hypothetical protein
MSAERTKAVRQYVVYHLKLTELLHLMLLSFHLTRTGKEPDNHLGHGVDQFRETLLGAIASAFMSISDTPKSTNIREIWKQLHPIHARAIDRIWDRRISGGESVMKAYRDQAGAHGDHPDKYFSGKLGLSKEKEKVIRALVTFIGLSTCLLRRQVKEIPELASEIEGVLLDAELKLPATLVFNRRWLRTMHLIESGSYTKTFS